MATHNGTPEAGDLTAAAMWGDKELLESLLNGGADPNFPNAQGDSALHEAAYYGEVECASILLDHKGGLEEGTVLVRLASGPPRQLRRYSNQETNRARLAAAQFRTLFAGSVRCVTIELQLPGAGNDSDWMAERTNRRSSS